MAGNDRVDAFINTAAWTGIAYEMSAYKAIQGGVYYERLSLRIQIHTHGRAPLPGRGVSGKIYTTHININKIHIYLNPKMWKYFYPWWPWY